jgi:hypothetical protein
MYAILPAIRHDTYVKNAGLECVLTNLGHFGTIRQG